MDTRNNFLANRLATVWIIVLTLFAQSSRAQERVLAEVGSNTVLECNGDEQQDFDKTTVVWFFNNVSIVDTTEQSPFVTKRFSIGLSTSVADFSLIIVDTVLNDTGEYQCKTKMDSEVNEDDFEQSSLATHYLQVVTNLSLVEDEAGLSLSLPNQAIVLANQIISYIILILVMITMGANITLELIKEVLKRPSGLVIGVCCQFGIMPLIGFCFAHLFALPPNQAIGAIIIACCPGGTMSNIFTFWVKGDIPLSVCMTTVSTIAAIGLMPLCLFIYTRSWISGSAIIPYVDIIITLVSILAPMIVGMLIKWKFDRFTAIFSKVVSLIAFLGITTIVCLQVSQNPDLYFANWKPWVISPLYSICGFSLGFLIANVFGMTTARCYTIGIETGLQNTFLALAVLNLNFSGLQLLEMLAVPGLYGVISLVEGLIFVGSVRPYRRWKEKPKKKRKKPSDGNRNTMDSISNISRSVGGFSGFSSDTGLVVYENYGFDGRSSQYSYNTPSSHYSYNSQKSAPVLSFDLDGDGDIGVMEQDEPPLTPEMPLRPLPYMGGAAGPERDNMVLENKHAMMDIDEDQDDDEGGFGERRRRPNYDQGVIINPNHLGSLGEESESGVAKSTYI